MENSMAYWRKKAYMTQAEVAEKLGIDTSAVAKWETGKAMPRLDKLLKLAKLYGCTIEQLVESAA